MGKEIVSRTTFVKGVTACVVVAASLGIIKIGDYAVTSSEETAASTTATTGSASYTPGTYTATSAGISSDVSVTCTFDESSITAIEIDVSGETADIGAAIGDEMIEQFMAAQSSAVDGVSGATITSDALKAALEDCIAQATGGSSDEGEEAITEEESEKETAEVTETETESVAEADEEAETKTEDLAEADEDATDSAEAETAEAVADEDTSSQTSSSARYTPGTYTATAAGMESDVTVTITVDENSILSVGCNVSGETEGVGAAIGPEIIAQILDAQSADVDGVSGATVTSDAVKTAAADALSQAAGDAAEPSEEETDDAEADTAEPETDTDIEAEAVEDETDSADADAEESEADTDAVEMETESAEAESDMETAKTDPADAETESAEEDAAAAASGAYTPGTYSASAAGIASDVTVTIIVDEDSILSVGYDLSGETDGIGADIGPEISAQILAAQSADIDGVSGATVTSDAVKSAIADCIAQAQADTSGTAGESAADTEDDAEPESEDETEAGTDDAETEEAETELTTTDALEADYVSSFTPGTYSSTAEGYSAEITVTMTFDETSILEMDADTSGETSTYALIDEDVIAQILEAQSVDVDGISGATATTDAILEAAADCIAQAQSDSAADIIGGADGSTAIFVAGKEEETESEEETGSEDVSAAYVPGSYTASADGISSTITVSVSFDENRMYRIDYDLSGETEDIGAAIGPEITSRILDAQSAEVDGVTGATVTSDAVKSAVADCITQALSDAK
ncbi:MAG: FMN-binding protein [Lachnospiraceae bacterium]|nr:FMN-binding protein [Lachnospiraceae bacterium]